MKHLSFQQQNKGVSICFSVAPQKALPLLAFRDTARVPASETAKGTEGRDTCKEQAGQRADTGPKARVPSCLGYAAFLGRGWLPSGPFPSGSQYSRICLLSAHLRS